MVWKRPQCVSTATQLRPYRVYTTPPFPDFATTVPHKHYVLHATFQLLMYHAATTTFAYLRSFHALPVLWRHYYGFTALAPTKPPSYLNYIALIPTLVCFHCDHTSHFFATLPKLYRTGTALIATLLPSLHNDFGLVWFYGFAALYRLYSAGVCSECENQCACRVGGVVQACTLEQWMNSPPPHPTGGSLHNDLTTSFRAWRAKYGHAPYRCERTIMTMCVL